MLHMEALIESVLKEVLGSLGVVYSGVRNHEVAGQKIYHIESEVDGKTLIGPHGETLHALDMLVKRIVERKATPHVADGPRTTLFLVDVNNYRAEKIKDLEQKSLMMAERARSLQYDVELEPMSSYERLIVHSVLAGQPHIKTESQGDGHDRRIVIRYTTA